MAALMLKLHWNNPQLSDQYWDSSGLNLFITKSLRPYNASVVLIGDIDLRIPPRQHSHVVHGSCDSHCTQDYMTGPVNVFAAFNHMHYLGKSGHSSMIRPDGTSNNLAYDPEYSYDSPVIHSFDPIVMNPGDQLTMQCNYRTVTKTKTTFFGDETTDEMCFAFVYFYPAENFRINRCIANNAYHYCSGTLTVYNGCDFTKATNTSDPVTYTRYVNITEKCDKHSCLQECMEVVKIINQDPCYGDDNNRRILKELAYESDQNREDVLKYWARLDSCEKQLALDSCPTNVDATWGTNQGTTNKPTGETCGATGISGSHTTTLVFIAALIKISYNFM